MFVLCGEVGEEIIDVILHFNSTMLHPMRVVWRVKFLLSKSFKIVFPKLVCPGGLDIAGENQRK
jgi:hypothetical protein